VNGTVRTGMNRNQELVLDGWDRDLGIVTASVQTDGIRYRVTDEEVQSTLSIALEEAEANLQRYAGRDAALEAFYTAEIARLEAQLEANGLLQAPTDLGAGVTVPDGYLQRVEQRALNVIIEPIRAQAGLIDVRADQLTGTGDIVAPGDASVRITNNTPAFVQITGIIIPEQNGGLFLNGEEVSDAGSKAAILAEIRAENQRNVDMDNARNPNREAIQTPGTVAYGQIDAGAAAGPPFVLVENTLDVTSSAATQGEDVTYAWPGITVLGDIDNLGGNVTLRAFAAGGGSIATKGTIRALSQTIEAGVSGAVTIDAPGTIQEIGGAANAAWNALTNGGVANAEGSPALVTAFLNTPAKDISLIGERVFITAEFVNINGIIASRTATRSTCCSSNTGCRRAPGW
jgi:hypothetical protein